MYAAFDVNSVQEVTRSILLTLWNVYSFFVTYANIDNYIPGQSKIVAEPSELDKWLISELNQLILDVDNALANYDPTGAGRKIESFVDELSNWYVRRSRRRFWKSESDTDKLAAYNTLYDCLVTLTKLMAPFTPFIAEEIYRNLVCSVNSDAPESVHLTDFPVADESKINSQLADDVNLALKVCSLGRAARSDAKIKVRQPLAIALIGLTSSKEKECLARVKPQILEELNVKDIQAAGAEELAKPEYKVNTEGGYSVGVPIEIPAELKAEGMVREIVHRLQTMPQNCRLRYCRLYRDLFPE